MKLMMVSLAIIVSVTSAVFVNTSEGTSKKFSSSGTSKGWQYFNLYHPSSPQIYFNTDTHVYPKYEFEYAVSDQATGDHKHHHETRDGDKVRGEYSLIEPDGSLRNVQYNADHYNGFNAIVSTSVQKHGDQAISTFEHARHFLPMGHDVKINHFFPNKDYIPPRHVNLNENLRNKPVKEYDEDTVLNINSSDIIREMESINMEPKNVEYSTMVPIDNDIGMSPITKMETIEGPSAEIMPSEISNTDYDTSENSEQNNRHKHISKNNDGIYDEHGKNSTDEFQHLHKPDTSVDSEIAPSYFSRIYHARV